MKIYIDFKIGDEVQYTDANKNIRLARVIGHRMNIVENCITSVEYELSNGEFRSCFELSSTSKNPTNESTFLHLVECSLPKARVIPGGDGSKTQFFHAEERKDIPPIDFSLEDLGNPSVFSSRMKEVASGLSDALSELGFSEVQVKWMNCGADGGRIKRTLGTFMVLKYSTTGIFNERDQKRLTEFSSRNPCPPQCNPPSVPSDPSQP